MTKQELREELKTIIVKGSARGDGAKLTRREAGIVLDELVASDTAPEWDCCREPGRSILRRVITEYYRPMK